ncbi:MAG: hypothetical protein J7L39_02605 [Candidatus Aenigmarchaeota archaeon]|nr:hypothetical protein [Candidatus Aenigmarchaeota archaeon]
MAELKRDFVVPFSRNFRISVFYSFPEGYGYICSFKGNDFLLFFPNNKGKLPNWVKKIAEKMEKSEHIKGNMFVSGSRDVFDEFKKKIVEVFENKEVKNISEAIPITRFWKEVPKNINEFEVITFFGFFWRIKDGFDIDHVVHQIQWNYFDKNSKSKVIIEVLKFCRCPTITDNIIMANVLDYITKRREPMKYRNLVKKVNLEKRYSIIVSGDIKEKNEKLLEFFDKKFSSWLENTEL